MQSDIDEVQCSLGNGRFTRVQLDLNLLPVLQALVEEGSVTGAAERLRLSPPAVSRSLGRLRTLTGDGILVRTGRTMTRTPYALAVRDELSEVLRCAERILTPGRGLDLAVLERVFALRMHDALTAAIAPTLLATVQASAPGVRLRFLAETDTDAADLRLGHVDLEIGSTIPTVPELRHDVLGADSLVAVMRAGNAAARRLDLDTFIRASHIVVSRRGRLIDPVDTILAERGATRSVIASVGSLAAALQIVASSDAMLTAPRRALHALTNSYELEVVPLPFASSTAPVVSVWHHRSDTDLAHGWLRDIVRNIVVGLLKA